MSHSLLACGSRGGSTESILAWKRHSSVTGEACKHRCSSVSVTRLQIVGTDNCMMQLHMYILYTYSNAKSYVYTCTCMCLIPLLGYSTMIVLHVYSIWERGENSGHQLALIGRAGASPLAVQPVRIFMCSYAPVIMCVCLLRADILPANCKFKGHKLFQ